MALLEILETPDQRLRTVAKPVETFDEKLAQLADDICRRYPGVQRDLLVTGGDPMVMKTKNLVQYLEPLLQPEFDHIQTIRIGTKALSYWPFRFLGDEDAEALLDTVLVRYIEADVYHAVLENLASEHAARMVAMKNATENAGELIEDLTAIASGRALSSTARRVFSSTAGIRWSSSRNTRASSRWPT